MSGFEIKVKPGTPQRLSVTLSGIAVTMQLKWCKPAAAWILDLRNSAGELVAGGLPVVTGADLLGQLKYLGLGGGLIAQTDHQLDLVPGFDTLGDTGHLYYVSPPP